MTKYPTRSHKDNTSQLDQAPASALAKRGQAGTVYDMSCPVRHAKCWNDEASELAKTRTKYKLSDYVPVSGHLVIAAYSGAEDGKFFQSIYDPSPLICGSALQRLLRGEDHKLSGDPTPSASIEWFFFDDAIESNPLCLLPRDLFDADALVACYWDHLFHLVESTGLSSEHAYDHLINLVNDPNWRRTVALNLVQHSDLVSPRLDLMEGDRP